MRYEIEDKAIKELLALMGHAVHFDAMKQLVAKDIESFLQRNLRAIKEEPIIPKKPIMQVPPKEKK